LACGRNAQVGVKRFSAGHGKEDSASVTKPIKP
jgi:hypothetical protein